MASDEQWYVLVEANYGFTDTQWKLEEKCHVVGGRSAALSRAEEICRTWCPFGWKPEECGRTVFEVSETSWLVELVEERWPESDDHAYTRGEHFRVTVARVVHAKEAPPAHPPEKKAGAIRRAFGGGR
ncbi:hypothetical protein [Streptomyces liliifuscus]|uniref:Uncharacterized protein n=1 Tax=Streptomyces liliifuscus TaxID=2797636 RepID=A0A7T7HZN9_9ACTN|nr:hypothetical protein [Streptomyces liliifuscus]QQM38287.1 hypothetical protein JEQ17_01515 [Streptomyces liliifuscus]